MRDLNRQQVFGRSLLSLEFLRISCLDYAERPRSDFKTPSEIRKAYKVILRELINGFYEDGRS